MTVPYDVKVRRRQALTDHRDLRVPLSDRVQGAMARALVVELEMVRIKVRSATFRTREAGREYNPIDRAAWLHGAARAKRDARRYLAIARKMNTGIIGPEWSGWIH